MDDRKQMPNPHQLSIVTATILLSYAISPFVNILSRDFSIEFAGIIFDFMVDFNTIVSMIVPILAAVGTYWLIHSSVDDGERPRYHHGLLPAISAWVIGLPLNELEVGPQWWVVLSLGGVLLVSVLVAEYVVADFLNERHAIASAGLKAVSFALYLFLLIALRAANLRLYLLLPSLILPLALVCLRTLYLHLGGKWLVGWSVGIALVVGQFAVGLHYWPIKPLTFGLILLGPAYGINSIAGSIEDQQPLSIFWIEPLIMLVIFWGLAFIFRG